jgi:hypothetical protein
MNGHFLPVVIPGTGVAKTHSIHYADANDAEISINREFISRIEVMFSPRTDWAVSDATLILLDFIQEARKLERLEDRGEIFVAPDLNFTLAELFAHLPLQYWPMPLCNHCPCPFCDGVGDAHEME